jgi:alpha-galactosidase
MLDDGTATEEDGQVWSAALAWSGSWRITVARTPEDRLSVTGGFRHDDLIQTLGPGETLTTPPFLGLYTAAGFGAASRSWHSHLRAHLLLDADEIRPVLFNSWGPPNSPSTKRSRRTWRESPRHLARRDQLVLNFARPDVAHWAHSWLDALVTDHAIDFLK